MHGDMRALETANRIRRSDIWFFLNGKLVGYVSLTGCVSNYVQASSSRVFSDFSMVLATITASLANFLKLQESDVSLVDIMGEGDEQNNLEDDKIAAAESGDEMSGISTPSTTSDKRIHLPIASSRSQHNKKLPESWDDEDLGDSSSKSEDEEMWRGSSESGDEDDKDDGHKRSVEELEQGFRNIYKAFSKLQLEFNTKFKAIFA